MSNPIREVQTTFGVGPDHFSAHHSQHGFGSTAPIQRDLSLRLPSGRQFKPLCGMDSPPGVSIQTTLRDFRI